MAYILSVCGYKDSARLHCVKDWPRCCMKNLGLTLVISNTAMIACYLPMIRTAGHREIGN